MLCEMRDGTLASGSGYRSEGMDLRETEVELRLIRRLMAEKAMTPHSSTLAWKIPWTEESGRLQSMGSLRVRHD